MKTRIPLLGRRLLVLYTILISVLYVPSIAFAMEPIGTIGQPLPEHHAFLPDGNILCAVPTHIQVIDPRTGKVIDEFGEGTYISEVVFSPTTEHLAILNYDSDSRITTINIWDTNAREQIAKWEIPASISVAAFSPIDSLFAISFNDEIHLWNWQIGAFRGKMIGQRRPWERCHSSSGGGRTCTSLPRDHASVFTSDGRYLIVASNRPDVELWNVKTRRLEGHFEGHTGNWVENAVLSPDGTRLATYEKDCNNVYVWNVETQTLLWQEESGISRISDVVFSPDNRHLYVAAQTGTLNRSGGGPWQGWDDQVRIWDVASGKQLDAFGDDFYFLKATALSPDGKTMLLHYWDAVVLWSIESKQPLNVWADFVYSWKDALSANGQTFISVTPYFIKTWDIPSRQMRLRISAERGLFRESAISSDGKKLAIGRDPWVEVRNLRTGAVENQFRYGHGYSDIAFSSTGRWVAARGFKSIYLFDLENPERIQRAFTEDGPDIDISSLFMFSENDAYLAASTRTDDNQYWVLLWKREGDTFVFQYAWQVPELCSQSRLAFGSDTNGSPLLAVPRTRETQIWKLLLDSPQLVKTLDAGFPAHFTPDGRYLFAGQDRYLQIWDWKTETLIEHSPIPDHLALSRDGTILLSYADTGQIQIWDAKALLPSKTIVTPHGKQIVILGEVKRNQLLQNFPNPFNPETWIPFQLTAESYVTIHIHNATGQLVRRLSAGTIPAGDHSSQAQAVYWDGRNQVGEPVSSGVYLYTIHAGDFSATRKMIIRK
ncbi:hypothetical protein C6500_14000 [Candidatus Poribacteria bacterium]|nr:MAG: hypothetical protein C6500_14000 [Candidatus Poribacteria bacterium]